MRRPSKAIASFTLAVILSATTASARPAEDPGRDPGKGLINRIVTVVRHVVKVVLGDEMSVPHP